MTGRVFAQVELRLTIKFESATFDRVEPFGSRICIQVGTRGLTRIEMDLHHLLTIDPSCVGRDYRWMLSETRFAGPEARGRVSDGFAKAIFD
jgi:hypothetical protein